MNKIDLVDVETNACRCRPRNREVDLSVSASTPADAVKVELEPLPTVTRSNRRSNVDDADSIRSNAPRRLPAKVENGSACENGERRRRPKRAGVGRHGSEFGAADWIGARALRKHERDRLACTGRIHEGRTDGVTAARQQHPARPQRSLAIQGIRCTCRHPEALDTHLRDRRAGIAVHAQEADVCAELPNVSTDAGGANTGQRRLATDRRTESSRRLGRALPGADRARHSKNDDDQESPADAGPSSKVDRLHGVLRVGAVLSTANPGCSPQRRRDR